MFRGIFAELMLESIDSELKKAVLQMTEASGTLKLKNGKNKAEAHHHEHSSNGRTRLLIMLTMTFLFFVVEMVFGYFSHSMALIADSFHMLSDVMALGIAYGCMRIATRDTKKNTFGWVRAEVLGALVNGVFLLALCFTIFIESFTRIVEPEMIKEPKTVLIVGIIGFIINLIGMFLFHAHAHGHSHNHSHRPPTIEGEASHLIATHEALALAEFDNVEEDTTTSSAGHSHDHNGHLNMRGVFLHILGDAIGSVIVIATALVSWLVPGYDGLKLYMDPCLSLVMVCLMICTTLPLVRETALILLQTTPKFVEIEEIKNQLLKIDGVEAVHEFHVWCLVGERIIATVHIRFLSLRNYLDAAKLIRTIFHQNAIHSATIQPEFEEMGSGGCTFTCLPNNCNLSDVKCCKETTDGDTKSEPTSSTYDSPI